MHPKIEKVNPAEENSPVRQRVTPQQQNNKEEEFLEENENSQDIVDEEKGIVRRPVRSKSYEAPASNFDELASSYPISYELLAGDKIENVPSKLRYKPINGYNLTLLNELSVDTLDEGLNDILDSCCYESQSQGFSHWDLPNPEKVRAFINLRINSDTPIVDVLEGICMECGEVQSVIKVNLLDFNENPIKDEYKEPWGLKAKVRGEEVKFEARIIRSGDLHIARNTIAKNPDFIDKMFPGIDVSVEKNKESLIQILEYANSIISFKGNKVYFDEAVIICRDNIDIMKALTCFNDYFLYGMKMEKYSICKNKKCISNDKEKLKLKENPDEIARGSLHSFPIQPALIYIASGEDASSQYFDRGN